MLYQDEFHACQDLMEKMGRTAKEIAYVGVTQKDEAAGLEEKKDLIWH